MLAARSPCPSTVEDTFGNTITTGNTGSTDNVKVTPHLREPRFLQRTELTSVAALNGVANFSGLQMNTAGNYTITASDTTQHRRRLWDCPPG